MTKFYPCYLLIILFGLSSVSFAKSPLTQHAISVSQSMSAYYMYTLSEGDDRYQRDFDELLVLADKYLDQYQKQDPVTASEFKSKWQSVRSELDYESLSKTDYIVPSSTRTNFRRYLTSLYEKIMSSTNSETNLPHQLAIMELSVEIMTSRFFDISSALFGVQTLSSDDLKVDPVVIAKRFKQKLEKYQDMAISKSIKRDLSSVQSKWRFIEDTVINYKEQSAYLLVYYNKKKINKILNNSQSMLLARS